MPNSNPLELESRLRRLDGKSYKAYQEIRGEYQFPRFSLTVDRVQGDPFASPSRVRVIVPQSVAKFPPHLYRSPSREVALRDYLTRQFARVAGKISSHRGTGKSGLIQIARVTQEVLPRNSVSVDRKRVEVRFQVGLPARGRRILGYQALAIFGEDIPEIVDRSLLYANLEGKQIEAQVETVEDADYIRQSLAARKLVAFIPNGAILPRESGVDARPLKRQAIPFQSPPSLEVAFDCPNGGTVRGMGIGEGVTLIVGGGYHGKSTLLQAIELGIYNHVPGDGRELVVTEPSAVKIRAEDGRSIAGVNISPFLNHLPQGKSTANFSTTNASGSTSQGANIMEALEVGAQLLLIDEDTAATNFMIRDRRMQQLIAADKEPITPFIDKIGQLYLEYHVSTILVMGGSGDYFEVADTVIAMDNFCPRDLTAAAREIARNSPIERTAEGGEHFGPIASRIPLSQSINLSKGNKAVAYKVRDADTVELGSEEVDLEALTQIVDPGQVQAIAAAIVYARERYVDDRRNLAQIIALVSQDIEAKGLDVLTAYLRGDLVLFRKFELAATINRLRSLQVRQEDV